MPRAIMAFRYRADEFLHLPDSDCVPTDRLADGVDGAIFGFHCRSGFKVDASSAMKPLFWRCWRLTRRRTHAYIFSGAVKGAVFGYTNNMAVRREIFKRCGSSGNRSGRGFNLRRSRGWRLFPSNSSVCARRVYSPPGDRQRPVLAGEENALWPELSATSQGAPAAPCADTGRAVGDFPSDP